MTGDQILSLVQAGYTRAEIEAMIIPDQQPEPKPAEVKQPEQQPDPKPAEPQPDPKPDQPDELKALRDELNQAKQQIKDLTSQVQKNNLLDRGMEQLPGQDAAKNTDAVIGELIRPTLQERKGL